MASRRFLKWSNPQSAIRNPQSAIRNPQSAIRSRIFDLLLMFGAGMCFISIASRAAAEDSPFPPIEVELPELPHVEPFVPPDDSQPISPDTFFTLFPDEELPVSEYVGFDYDGDGIEDLVMPLPAFNAAAPAFGQIKVYSAWTGQLLHHIVSLESNDLFGFVTIGIPDITGDGKADLLVGAPASSAGAAFGGKVYLYSGADGALLATFRGEVANGGFGFACASIGDVNEDGVDDLAIGAPYDGPGRVFVFSGGTADAQSPPELTPGDAIMSFSGEDAGHLFGFSIARAGVVDDDAVSDLIIGAPGFDQFDKSDLDNRGRVYVRSGATGADLGTVTGDHPQQLLGYSVGSVGDFDGDGRDDLFMGAPTAPDAPGGGAYLFTDLYDGATPENRLSATAMVSFAPIVGDRLFGILVARSHDMNDDGVADLLVHAGFDANGDGSAESTRGYIFSGVDGGFLYTFTADVAPPEEPGDDDGDLDQIEIILGNFGDEDASPAEGDVNGDGVVDMIDLLIAIDDLASGGAGDGDPACLEPPYFNEEGELVDPCLDPDDENGCCGGNGPDDDENENGFWDPCEEITIPEPPMDNLDCALWAICTAADSVQNDLNALKSEKDAALADNDDAVMEALNNWQGSPNPNVVTPNSLRAHAERTRNVTIALAAQDASGDAGLGTAFGIATSSVAVAGSIVVLVAGGPVGWTVIIGGAIATGGLWLTVDSLNTSADNFQASVDAANQSFVTNPARSAFLNAVQQANSTLADICAALDQELDDILQQFDNLKNMLFIQCVNELVP